MSKRNLAWLVVVFGAIVLVGIVAGWLSGVIAGVTVLVVSELFERDRRRRRRGRSRRQARVGVLRGRDGAMAR